MGKTDRRSDDEDEDVILKKKRRLRRNVESKLRYMTSDMRSDRDDDGYETR